VAIFEFFEIISTFRVLITMHVQKKGNIERMFFSENIPPRMGKIFHQKKH
jgi:hypothetical protein